ncbi:MAG: hypothetical protein ACKVYV_11920 [Limisphaerales bacterium]
MSDPESEARMELLRDAILRVLDASSVMQGAQPEAVVVHVRAYGFEIKYDEAVRELQYLADKGLARQQPRPLNPNIKSWHITAAGRDVI